MTPDPIQDAAKRPKKTTTDGASTEHHSIPDKIAAEQHAANRNVLRMRNRGMVLSKIRFPGAA